MSEISAMSVDDALDYMDKLSRMSDVKLQEYTKNTKKNSSWRQMRRKNSTKVNLMHWNRTTPKSCRRLLEKSRMTVSGRDRSGKKFCTGHGSDSKTDIAGAVSGAVATRKPEYAGDNYETDCCIFAGTGCLF